MAKFYKYEGLGNDFILFNLSEEQATGNLNALQIRRLCHRQLGIGADGILLYQALEANQRLQMTYYNSDGSKAETCFNGLRCIALHGARCGDVKVSIEFKILQDAGVVKAAVDGSMNNVRIELPPAKYVSQFKQSSEKGDAVDNFLKFSFGKLRGTFLSLGNPHFVSWESTLNLTDLNKRVCQMGPIIEKSSHFEQGANFEIASIVNDHEINIAVWERGSGLTLACGSGAAAAVCAGVKSGSFASNKPVTVNMSGGRLIVTVRDDVDRIVIVGEAKFVFAGVVDIDNMTTTVANDD